VGGSGIPRRLVEFIVIVIIEFIRSDVCIFVEQFGR
jgi:hypothetical protein